MSSRLKQALAGYDGRDTGQLQEIAGQFSHDRDYVDQLIACFDAQPPTIADGATWLLLAHLRGVGDVSPQQVTHLIAGLTTLTTWGAQLHICQSARHLPLEADQAFGLAEWLRPLLNAKRPFVRAWALDAFIAVCALLPSHAGEGRMALEAALNDPAASVRARARNLS